MLPEMQIKLHLNPSKGTVPSGAPLGISAWTAEKLKLEVKELTYGPRRGTVENLAEEDKKTLFLFPTLSSP